MEERVREVAARVEARVFQLAQRWEGLGAAGKNRVLGIFIAAPGSLVLGIAAWLTPSADGFGTHRQLGLAGCAVMTVTGWPCPMCGMTTTFALMADGRVVDAIYNQPFGVVLFGMTLVATIFGIADVIVGRSTLGAIGRLLYPWERPVAAGLLIGLFGGWLWKSAVMHPVFFGWSPT